MIATRVESSICWPSGSILSRGTRAAARLRINNRAHVVFPFHWLVEKMSEARENSIPIGTTARGIGPCYEVYAAIRRQSEEVAECIRPMVCDTAMLLARAMAQGKRTGPGPPCLPVAGSGLADELAGVGLTN